MKLYLFPTLVVVLAMNTVSAQEKPNLTDPKQKVSYSLGASMGSNLKRQGVEVDLKAFSAGVADALMGKPALSEAEIMTVLTQFQKDMRAKMEAAAKEAGEKNLKEGPAFLAANGKKEGVKTTGTGLQYKVIKSGSGKTPKSTDKVKVHYHGTLIDGTVFDSSVERGEPISFPVNGVIAGWTEALQLMKEGDKWQLFIPSELAYGANPRPGGKIGPNSVLIFDVELLAVE